MELITYRTQTVTRSWCQSTSAIPDHVNTIHLIKEVLYMIMLTLHLWSSSQTRLTVSSPQEVPFYSWNQFQPSLHSSFGKLVRLHNNLEWAELIEEDSWCIPLQDLFSIFTFMFRFDDQLWLKSWLWQIKVKLHAESWLTPYNACEVCTPYLDTKISWESKSWWTKGDAPREMLIYPTNFPWSLDLTL